MSPGTVARVLERLGVAPPARDLAGLRAVYAAWCRGVSFDNVLKMIHVAEARPGPLPGFTAESFFEAWLACGAGGTCWAGNGALHGFLEALGFDAQRAIATMMPSHSPAPNHGSVVVSLDGERWITDASILTSEPLRIPAPGEPAETGPLPRLEWLDGKPAVIWRTLRLPEGFPCRIERIGADTVEWDALHRQSGVWSPFNFELSARVMRGDLHDRGLARTAIRNRRQRLDLRIPAGSRSSSALPRRGARHHRGHRTPAPGRPPGTAPSRIGDCYDVIANRITTRVPPLGREETSALSASPWIRCRPCPRLGRLFTPAVCTPTPESQTVRRNA